MVEFNSSCQYDIILGGDFLQKAGININYAESQVEWLNGHLPLQKTHEFYKGDKTFLLERLYIQKEEEWFGDDFMEPFTTTILDATYHKVYLDKVINNQNN